MKILLYLSDLSLDLFDTVEIFLTVRRTDRF